MKKINYEYVQRIPSHYVGDECLQVMFAHHFNSGISILNSGGLLYHYVPDSPLYVNQYVLDDRKGIFPYSKIPSHNKLSHLKKLEIVNQLLDFNKVYIEIANSLVIENFAIKDGSEALLATKILIPEQDEKRLMRWDEVLELLKMSQVGIFSLTGGYWQEYPLINEQELLQYYKEHMIAKRKKEINDDYNALDKNLTNFFYNIIDKITIDDVPSNITIANNIVLVIIQNEEIKKVKLLKIDFMSKDNYQVESYDLPITIYTKEDMQRLVQTSFQKVNEPKISSFLNPDINKSLIKEEREKVLRLVRNKK